MGQDKGGGVQLCLSHLPLPLWSSAPSALSSRGCPTVSYAKLGTIMVGDVGTCLHKAPAPPPSPGGGGEILMGGSVQNGQCVAWP